MAAAPSGFSTRRRSRDASAIRMPVAAVGGAWNIVSAMCASEVSAVLPEPEPEGVVASAEAVALARLEDQIGWYDRKSQHHQAWFKRLKVLQLVSAAAIPVAAAGSLPGWFMGAGGALIVVLEGLQQLQQYQQNWTTYRSTCERLKHEKFLYAAQAGPYAGIVRPERVLAERVEGLVSQEHAAWVSNREEANRRAGDAVT
jgi:hypothetical protein